MKLGGVDFAKVAAQWRRRVIEHFEPLGPEIFGAALVQFGREPGGMDQRDPPGSGRTRPQLRARVRDPGQRA
jgi:hypothetical protein